MKLTSELREQYAALWLSCVPHATEATGIAEKLIAHQERYRDVAQFVSHTLPWHFVALVHHMECGRRFDEHLHNGDPLTARTVRVPIGRPLKGEPPFTWEESAADALTLRGLWQVGLDWSIPGELYQLELYNGFGSRSHGINTPYLWSGSNHYSKGKFVADHVFDANAVSKQIGAATILKRILSITPEIVT